MSGSADSAPARRRWRLVWTLALTALLLGLLVREFAGTSEFIAAVLRARLELVALAFALSCGCVALTALRWVQVLAAIGHPLAFGRALLAVLAAWPISVVTPSRAGDFARALIVRDAVPTVVGTGSVLAEKVIDIHTLLVAALVGTIGYGLSTQSALIGAMIAAEWLAVIAILRGKDQLLRIRWLRSRADKVEQLYRAFDALLVRPGRILIISASSLAIRLLTVAIVHTLLAAVGVTTEFWRLVAPWMIATLAGLVPLTFGGMGTRDGAFLILVNASASQPLDEASLLAATMGYSLFAIASFALIGLPFLARSSIAQR